MSEDKQRFKRRVKVANAIVEFFHMAREKYPHMIWASSESINKHTLREATSQNFTDALEVMFCSGLFIRSPYTYEWTLDWDKWDGKIEKWIVTNSVAKERAHGYERYLVWLKKHRSKNQ